MLIEKSFYFMNSKLEVSFGSKSGTRETCYRLEDMQGDGDATRMAADMENSECMHAYFC